MFHLGSERSQAITDLSKKRWITHNIQPLRVIRKPVLIVELRSYTELFGNQARVISFMSGN
jgi:hypothetical protein